jgi:hypothetical protein
MNGKGGGARGGTPRETPHSKKPTDKQSKAPDDACKAGLKIISDAEGKVRASPAAIAPKRSTNRLRGSN